MCLARRELIDAGLQFGSPTIDQDRDESLSMFEGLLAPDRLDGTFFNATMDHINDHLSMYSHQVRIGHELTTTLPRCDTPLLRAHRRARPLVQFQPGGPYAKSVSAI